jgi:uncharacterized protein involved in exopolysaccharide biosynthesis
MTEQSKSSHSNIITDTQEVDLIRLLLALWQGKLWILLITAIVTGLATAYALLATPTYKVTSIWLPQQVSQLSGQMGQIAGIAGLMGMNLGASNSSIEQFYPQIITSPTILKKIIAKKWPTLSKDSATLDQVLKLDTNGLEPQLPNISRYRIMRSMLSDYLLGAIVFEGSPMSQVLTVTTPDPVLSCAINQFIIDELQNYVEENRVRTTITERDFFYQKYVDFKDSLSKAESRLLYYRLNNRMIISPTQMLEEDRLGQESATYSNLVTEFRKQYEMAQINISKKSSQFQILQAPEPPTSKSSPKRKLIFVAAIFVGALFGCFFVLVLFWWKNNHPKIKERIQETD